MLLYSVQLFRIKNWSGPSCQENPTSNKTSLPAQQPVRHDM